MDLARYNLQHGDPSHGDHATLISNWVEERALRAKTGITRHGPMELEKVVSSSTSERCISHSDAQQRAQSLYKEEFAEHSKEHFTPKVFNLLKWDEETRMYSTTYNRAHTNVASSATTAPGSYFPSTQMSSSHPRLQEPVQARR